MELNQVRGIDSLSTLLTLGMHAQHGLWYLCLLCVSVALICNASNLVSNSNYQQNRYCVIQKFSSIDSWLFFACKNFLFRVLSMLRDFMGWVFLCTCIKQQNLWSIIYHMKSHTLITCTVAFIPLCLLTIMQHIHLLR